MSKGWNWSLLAAFASHALHAAPVPAANPVLQAAANGIRDEAHSHNLGLKRFEVQVVVRGAVAETTIDADFANGSNMLLEGEFRLKLPQGAVVTGYALDVGGRMIDGVLVDAPRAKALYEARVRQRIDPGLAEVSNDNVFSTRVYPIQPGIGRHVRLRFAAPLDAQGLVLPLGIEAPADGWTIAVRISGASTTPPTVIAPDGRRLALVKGADGLAAAVEGKGKPLAGTLRILPGNSGAPLVSEHRSGERYVQLSGDLPAPKKGEKDASLRIYWDRSRARLKGDIAGDLALVRQVIAQAGAPVVELVAFNSSGTLRTTVASADAAADWLGKLAYRGASSYAALGKEAPAAHCLLFAQGAPTIDRNVSFSPACRLDAISSSPEADKAWLRHIAQSHGGEAHDLATGGEVVAKALAETRSRVMAVVDQDGRDLAFVPLPAPQGHWLVLARLPEAGPLTIRVAGQPDVVQRVEDEGVPFDALAALVAADRLALLGATDQRQRYVDYSRRYGIASPSLSFLVLETPWDYVNAHIDPPASMPSDLRDDVLRQAKSAETARVNARVQWLDRVERDWRETVNWWSKHFDPAARPRRVAASEHFDQTDNNVVVTGARRRSGRNPPPPIVAPPPPINIAPVAAPVAPPAPVMAPPAPVAPSLGPSGPASRPSGGVPRAAPSATIQIEPWQADRPYLELYDGKPYDFDERFVEAERRHGGLPIFYLDTAEWLRRNGRAGAAAEMVLSALELPSANATTLGLVADRLERYGEIDRAIELRERQVALEPLRPQPRRLLALALARRAAVQPAHAREDLTRAVDLLYAIVSSPEDGAWTGITQIALDEVNALLPRLRAAGGKAEIDPRLVKLIDVDTRVVIDWTTDASDMDLWLDEPNGERAIYSNPRTVIGGHLSQDVTRGYGPEEYMLHVAPPGTYTIQANVYAPDRLDPNGATVVTAHLFRDFGRSSQREESLDIEIKRDEKGAKKLGAITVTGRK